MAYLDEYLTKCNVCVTEGQRGRQDNGDDYDNGHEDQNEDDHDNDDDDDDDDDDLLRSANGEGNRALLAGFPYIKCSKRILTYPQLTYSITFI